MGEVEDEVGGGEEWEGDETDAVTVFFLAGIWDCVHGRLLIDLALI